MGGRPTKFNESFEPIARKLCALGATDKDLAEAFGVTEQTINNWKRDFSTFFESLKEAKNEADEKVEAALYKRSLGFKRTVQKTDKNGALVELEEELPPDPTSMIFWLKNRKPQKWRDKQDIEHSGDVKVYVNIYQKSGDKS